MQVKYHKMVQSFEEIDKIVSYLYYKLCIFIVIYKQICYQMRCCKYKTGWLQNRENREIREFSGNSTLLEFSGKSQEISLKSFLTQGNFKFHFILKIKDKFVGVKQRQAAFISSSDPTTSS